MLQIELDERYLVIDSGTSDGTQDKYYKDAVWYKLDRYGNEGYHESLVSKLLACSDLPASSYVYYEEAVINGSRGCFSKSFLASGEEFISIYRLHKNVTGRDIAAVFREMEFEEQADYLSAFIKKECGISIDRMLGDLFYLDSIILNDDRHMNNIGLIFDGSDYRPAPIFDNGKSFFCGNKKYDATLPLSENLRHVRFRPFTATIDMMVGRYPEHMHFEPERLKFFFDEDIPELERSILTQRLISDCSSG